MERTELHAVDARVYEIVGCCQFVDLKMRELVCMYVNVYV